jgi:predicted aspartyl protease
MTSYDDQNFDPPAPFAEVLLRNTQTGAEISPVRMLIDTGADVTLIPRDAAMQIGCPQIAVHMVSGFDGTTSISEEVLVEMIFLGKSFTGQFLTINQPMGIIGRNILNYLTLTFDGPNRTWQETKR